MPPVPAETGLKKIELSVEQVTEVLPPALRAAHEVAGDIACPEARRAPPLQEPPRLIG